MKTTCDKCGRTQDEHRSRLRRYTLKGTKGSADSTQHWCYFCSPKKNLAVCEYQRKKAGKITIAEVTS